MDMCHILQSEPPLRFLGDNLTDTSMQERVYLTVFK